MKFVIVTAIAASIAAGLHQDWIDFLEVQTSKKYIPNPDQFLTNEFDLIWNVLSNIYEDSKALNTVFDSIYYCKTPSGIEEMLYNLSSYCEQKNPGYEAFKDLAKTATLAVHKCSPSKFYYKAKNYYLSWLNGNGSAKLLKMKEQSVFEQITSSSEDIVDAFSWDIDEIAEEDGNVLVIHGDLYLDLECNEESSAELESGEETAGKETIEEETIEEETIEEDNIEEETSEEETIEEETIEEEIIEEETIGEETIEEETIEEEIIEEETIEEENAEEEIIGEEEESIPTFDEMVEEFDSYIRSICRRKNLLASFLVKNKV